MSRVDRALTGAGVSLAIGVLVVIVDLITGAHLAKLELWYFEPFSIAVTEVLVLNVIGAAVGWFWMPELGVAHPEDFC